MASMKPPVWLKKPVDCMRWSGFNLTVSFISAKTRINIFCQCSHIKSYRSPLSQRRRARRENIDWFLTKNTDPSFAYLAPWREMKAFTLAKAQSSRSVYSNSCEPAFAFSAPLREHKSLNLQRRLDKSQQQLSDQVGTGTDCILYLCFSRLNRSCPLRSERLEAMRVRVLPL